jgi:hypothetical protein
MRDLSLLAAKCPHYKFPEGNNIKYRKGGQGFRGVPSDRIFYHNGFGGSGRHCLVAEGYGGFLSRAMADGMFIHESKPIFMNKDDLIPPIYIPNISKVRVTTTAPADVFQWHTGYDQAANTTLTLNQYPQATQPVLTQQEQAHQALAAQDIRGRVEAAMQQVDAEMRARTLGRNR